MLKLIQSNHKYSNTIIGLINLSQVGTHNCFIQNNNSFDDIKNNLSLFEDIVSTWNISFVDTVCLKMEAQ
jgi:hypothetical protein